ncbi:MAG: tetratricopeptide repeat protein [Lachnospiraceae bacterium]|nr:tetratricopeptide repeat protein [Lachnospiraceae bacterium]
MDKYELSIKEEKIKKHAEKKDYAAAVKIADTIDWSKIKNIKMLTLVSQVYEKAKNYTEAKNVLLIAYERVPMGRRMLYKLTELCVKEGNIEEAESYFEEFKKVAPGDTNQLLLAYQIETARSGDLDQMIAILEEYQKHEFEEKWLYELAFLYHRAGRVKECVKLCKDIILWFSVGVYVDRALNLKMQYEPLTPAEQEKLVNKKKFEARVRAVEREFEKREYRGIRGDEDEVLEQRRKREQIQEAAMTGEPATEEVTSEQEPPFAEEPEPDNVIPFAAVQSPAPEAEPPAERIADEIFDMQSDLAQAVLEAEKAPDPEEGQTQEEIFGQTREVVKETRKALEQERKQELGETEEFLNDVSAALAASAFAEETPVVLEREEEPPVLSEQEEEKEEEAPALSEREEEKEEEAPVH